MHGQLEEDISIKHAIITCKSKLWLSVGRFLFADQGVAGDRTTSAPLELRVLPVSLLGAAGAGVYRSRGRAERSQQQRASESGAVRQLQGSL